jgi:hypothetical protein
MKIVVIASQKGGSGKTKARFIPPMLLPEKRAKSLIGVGADYAGPNYCEAAELMR